MAIIVFQNTSEGRVLAAAVADPKHMWFDGRNIVVYTGVDIQNIDPRPTVSKWQLIQACADAGISEAQIDAAVLTLTNKRQRFWKHTDIIDRDNPFSTGLRKALTPVPTPNQWNAIFVAAAALDPLIV